MMTKLLSDLRMIKKVTEISPGAGEIDLKDTAFDKDVKDIEPRAKVF